MVRCDIGSTYCAIELLIVRKKKVTTECDKSTVRSNVGTAQCNNGTVKFKKCLNLNMLTFDLKQSRASDGLTTSCQNK